jgi:hypothetical protein
MSKIEPLEAQKVLALFSLAADILGEDWYKITADISSLLPYYEDNPYFLWCRTLTIEGLGYGIEISVHSDAQMKRACSLWLIHRVMQNQMK